MLLARDAYTTNSRKLCPAFLLQLSGNVRSLTDGRPKKCSLTVALRESTPSVVKIDVIKDFTQFERFVSLLKQLRACDKGTTAKQVSWGHASPLLHSCTHPTVYPSCYPLHCASSWCSLHGAQGPHSQQPHGTPVRPRSSLVGCFQCKWQERAKQSLTACPSAGRLSTGLLSEGPSQVGTPPQQRHKQDSHNKRHAGCWLCLLSHHLPSLLLKGGPVMMTLRLQLLSGQG